MALVLESRLRVKVLINLSLNGLWSIAELTLRISGASLQSASPRGTVPGYVEKYCPGTSCRRSVAVNHC